MDKLYDNPDSAKEKKIIATQVKALYRAFPITIFGSFFGAYLLAAVQWDVINHDNLLAWLVVFSSYNLARAILIIRFNKTEADDDKCIIMGKQFFYGSVIGGLIWCAGVIVTFPHDNFPHQLIVVIVVFALSAGAVSTLSILRSSFIATVSPMMATIIILFLMQGSYISTIISVMAITASAFVFRGANDLYNSRRDNIRLLLEAAEREKLLLDAKQQVEDASKAKSEFFANMSHELRTPLHGIISYARFGLDRIGRVSEQKIREYFSLINSSGNRLKLLLDDLLDLSKIESGKIVLNHEQVDLTDIINECVSEQNSIIESRNLRLKYELDKAPATIRCDKGRIGQVVMNILSNAIKHSPDGGEIRFAATSEKNPQNNAVYTHVTITDQGPGIAEDEFELIFDKFVQSKKNVCNSKGTGLGLAISAEIINAHNGKIWCDNATPHGANFHFVLPV